MEKVYDDYEMKKKTQKTEEERTNLTIKSKKINNGNRRKC